MLRGETRVLLAVSGGADSRALMEAAAELSSELGVTFAVGTVDHGLRTESAAESAEVLRAARALGLEAVGRRVSLPSGAGIEDRARILREAALEEFRKELRCELIATAHTASDQAETLLMRLARGSSLQGARSILARKGSFVRPLLGVTAEEARCFLQERDLSWAEDPMNADPQFFRVRVRRSVLPAFREAAGFEVAHPLARFAALAAEDEALLSDLADEAMRRSLLKGGALSVEVLKPLPRPILRRVLARLLRENSVPFDADHLEASADAVLHGGRIGLARGATLETAGGRARIVVRPDRSEKGRASGEPLQLELGKATLHPASGWRFLLTAPSVDSPADFSVPLPSARVWVRARRPGDRVLLSSGHTKKLQDLLVDAKVPREKRDAVPLIEMEGHILWVPGVAPPPKLLPERALSRLHAFAPTATGGQDGSSL